MPTHETTAPERPATLDIEAEEGGGLLIRLAGSWTLETPGSLVAAAAERLQLTGLRRIRFEASGLDRWDSGLLIFLVKLLDQARTQGIEAELSGLPSGVQRLLRLAFAVPERIDARRQPAPAGRLVRIGLWALGLGRTIQSDLAFLGEVTVALYRFVTGRARYQRSELWLAIQQAGVGALPIVSLISILVGMILAFVGAIQLQRFGAGIYIANLVGLGMAREMGAMMTAIIMAGRTGAAYASQLGTMQVNEEIDALRTFGYSPMEFLVVPRMIALITMMPLLTLYADLLGILGGAIVGCGMLDLTVPEYYAQTVGAVNLRHFASGLIKSVVFGVIVASAGCLYGMRCGRSASAVGEATTAAVVSAIVFIVVADATLTIIYNVLHF